MGSSRTTPLGRRSRKHRPRLRGGAAKAPLQAAKRLAPLLGDGAAKAPLQAAKRLAPLLGAGAAKTPVRAVGRPSWKLIGLAGIAGVAATGVVVARNRRAHRELPPDELRERLHRRLAQVGEEPVSEAGAAGEAAPSAPPG
jgi:hypothetical protein